MKEEKEADTDNKDMLRQIFPDKNAVKIFPDDFLDDLDASIPELIDRRTGHFSNRRVAILIRPGTYENATIPVGYWTQVLGLGATPTDTILRGRLGVYALPANTQNPDVGSLDTFWRSAENFTSKCQFFPDSDNEGEWCVPLNGNTTSSERRLYPVDNLTHQEHGYPPDQVPPSTYTPQYGMLWAVSQAAPLRRIHVQGNLLMSLGNHCASGGFVSNTLVDGYLQLGSQQQYCVRNCETNHKATGGAWSFVLAGCCRHNIDSDRTTDPIEWATKPGLVNPVVVNEPTTACRIEKPFLFMVGQQLYLGIPPMQHFQVGVDHQSVSEENHVPILVEQTKSKVRVFAPHQPIGDIQDALDNDCHVILGPGTYHWNQTLHVKHNDQVVLGIGMATVQAPLDGSPCIHVDSTAEGVRIAGLSLEASAISKYEGSTLLQWGDLDGTTTVTKTTKSGNVDNPGAMHDLYCFVGGRSLDRSVSVETMVAIHTNHVVGDNLWLWRADHVQLLPNEQPNKPDLSEYHVTEYRECRCDVGLKVYGHHVTMYGLAVEHTYHDMVEWYGTHGSVYFYQSELPYDVSGEVYQDKTGYHVHKNADHHVAKGVGVYSYFRDYDNVRVLTAVKHDATTGWYHNVFTVWLNGYRGMESIINGTGASTEETGKPYIVKKYRGKALGWRYFGGSFPGWMRTLIASIWIGMLDYFAAARRKQLSYAPS